MLVEHGAALAAHTVRIVVADFTKSLDLDDGEFDLLVSLTRSA